MTDDVLQSDDMAAYEFAEPVPSTDACGEPVGVLEIAERLGVQDRSVHMMKRRERLPRPDYAQINGSAAWDWRTILWWAGETGRLRTSDLVHEYRATFGYEPPVVVNGQLVEYPPRPKRRSRSKARAK